MNKVRFIIISQMKQIMSNNKTGIIVEMETFLKEET